jgi:hypothetical protein
MSIAASPIASLPIAGRQPTGVGGVVGTQTSSQAQTSAASGSHTVANVTGVAAISQAQTSSATGTHTPAAVTATGASSQAQTSSASGAFSTGVSGSATSSQAQSSIASGSHTIAAVTGTATTSQAQTSAATGTQTIGVSGAASSSQAQTNQASGSFTIQAVGGAGTSSQAQTTSAIGNGDGQDAAPVSGGIDLFEAQRRNRRKTKEKPDDELTEKEAEIKALMQVAIQKSKKTAKSIKAAQMLAIKPIEPPNTELVAPKVIIEGIAQQANLISDDEIEIILSLMMEMM